MNPYKFYALIDKTNNKILQLVMESERPDVSYIDNFCEIIEVTETTYSDLQGAW
jgi:hypothetical protein